MNNVILVTGGTGLVGTYLKELLPDGIFLSSSDCDLRNINDVRTIFNFIKPDIIVHAAAHVGGILDNINNPVNYLENNLLINTNVIRMAHEFEVNKLIGLLSSCAYPDVVDKYPMIEADLFRSEPTKTNYGYAYSKRCMALQIDLYKAKYEYDWSYMIPCNLYGKYDKFGLHNSHLVSSLIEKLKNAEHYINLLGTGKSLRQFMYAGDLAVVIKYFIDNNINENVNVANNEIYSIREIAKIALKACNKKYIKLLFDENELLDGQYRKDISSEKLLSIMPELKFTSLFNGIKSVYEYKNKN